MARTNRSTWTNRSARTRGRRLAAPRAATQSVIVASIVLTATTGLAGFTWVMTGPAAVAAVTATPTAAPKTAVPPPTPPMAGPGVHIGPPRRLSVLQSGTAPAGIVAGQSPAAKSGSSYWLFSLISAVADAILVLLTAALAFIYLLLRRTPAELPVRRFGRGGRSSQPGRDESAAGQPGGAGARQITAGPTAPGGVVPRPGTKLLTGTFDWFVSRDEPADKSTALLEEAPRGQQDPPPPLPDAPVSWARETVYHTRLAEVQQVLLGGDRIRVTLVADDTPDLVTDLVAPHGRPYGHHLAWAPPPYDTPEDGIAFACLGSSDRHRLFLDLGQAPSAVTIGGDPQAATRLTESIAHQLCATSASVSYTVVIIGDALRKPHPPTATWLASLKRLGAALAAHPSQVTAIVFCKLDTAADAQTLTDHVADARCRVVPVVLNGPLEESWSITATPAAEVSTT